MAFPDDRMPVRLRAAFGADADASPSTWTWTDITADVNAQQVTINRGQPNEGGEPQPTSMSLVLDNPHGNYTPDNAMGDYWPNIDQGVPLEYSLGVGLVHLSVDGAGGRATTPDDPALDITGDLDIRLDAELDNWGQGAFLELAAKQEFTTEQRSWRLVQLGATGRPELVWFTDGTAASGTAVSATVPLPVSPGERIALRVTLDVDNGAGGWTVTWYTAPTIQGPWTQLGDPITGAGVTSIFNSNAPLDLGDVAGMLLDVPRGRYYAFELRNGVNGTLVASPDFTALAVGTTSFADSSGRAWTVTGAAAVDDWKRRFVGHVDSWEPVWPHGDLSHEDAEGNVDYEGESQVTVTASGILRRLGQGEEPLQSTLRRRIPSFSPVAYWPMEEGRNATSVSSPIEGVRAFTPTGFDFAADDTLPGSSPLPSVGSPASFAASVPPAAAGEWQMELVYFLESLPTTESTLFEVRATGAARRVRVRVATNLVRLQGFDAEDNELFNGVTTAPQFTGAWNRLQIRAVPDGGSVDYSGRWVVIGGTGFSQTETIAGSAGYVTQVRSAFENLEGLRFGHLAVFDNLTDQPFSAADQAFSGETAGARMIRLCGEEGLDFSLIGDAASTEQMGPQRPAALTELLTECAAVDGGILGEQRDAFGLQYRTRTSLYNQVPALVLDAAANEIVNPFAPVLDDQRLRNAVTLSREGGSSATAVDGASIARRRRYATSLTVNAFSDDRLPALAAWRLHLGTWPGMRYPSVSTELAIAPQLIEDWLQVDYGARLQVTNLPPQHPADIVDLLLQGYSETISPTRWTVQGNCTPGGPWSVAVVGDDARGRVDANPSGSALAVAADSDDTLIVVHTPARGAMGPAPWITSAGPAPTYPAEFPYDIRLGGETARVLANAPVVWDTFNRAEALGPVLNANSTFEQDLDGWAAFGGTIDRVATPEAATAPFPGQWSMQLTPDGIAEFPNAGSDLIPVVAGSAYNLSGWLLCATARSVGLNVNWFDAGSAYMSTDSNDQAVTADTWTRFTDTVTAPVGAAFANLAPTVPDFPPPTDVLWADQIEFSAVVANTWGRSDGPSTWAETGGVASDRSLNGTAGVITLAANPSTIRFQRLVAGLTDVEVLVRVSVSQVATGSAMLPSVLLRFADTGNYYRARVHFGLTGAMSASITRDTTAVGSTVTLPYTYSAGAWFWMRGRLTGHRVQLRVWPDGQLEPAVWHKDETIASGTIASGQVGVSASAFAENTNVSPQLRYDDFTIVTPQLMTVQRSLNGVVKAHAVGTEVRVANPAVVPL